MKIFEPVLIQRNKLCLDFYNEEKPYTNHYATLEAWKSKKQTVEVDPSQENEFKSYAYRCWFKKPESRETDFIFTHFENCLKAGVSIPNDEIEVKADYSKSTFTTETGWVPKPICYAWLSDIKIKMDFSKFKKVFDESFNKVTPSEFVQRMENLGYSFINNEAVSSINQETVEAKLRNQLTPIYSLAKSVLLLENNADMKPIIIDMANQVLKNSDEINKLLIEIESK